MYNAIEKQQILTAARESIRHGLNFGSVLHVEPQQYSFTLRKQLATFVTLKIDNILQGCFGNLVPKHPLVESVVHNAYGAAFKDPRFSPVHVDDFQLLDIEVDVLSELELMDVSSEDDLLERLQPARDGLVISIGEQSATFLPKVWQQLDDPQLFLQQLKENIGLTNDEWPSGITVERFSAHTISSKSASSPTSRHFR